MSSYDEMMKFISRVKEEASHVDWLINNVGISTYAKYEDYTFNEWTKIVNTNLSVCISGERTSPHYERRRHSFYRLLRRTAGLFLISGLRCHQIRHSFPYQILVKELEPKQIRSMPLPQDLLKPAGIRTALRKAMNALTVRLRFTALVRSQKWQIWHTKF